MSVLTLADNPNGIDAATQPDPLQGDVEAFVLNVLDTTIHPSYGVLQQIAQVRSGRPVPTSLSPGVPFTISGTLSEISDDNDKEEDLPLDELYHDAEEESRRFLQAMDEYEKATENKQKKVPGWSRNKHTWKEVLEEVDVASSQYNDPSGFWGKIRKVFRRGGDNAGPASAWLVLLPTQSEYFSVLCGGLKLIIGAAARLNDLRDDIAKALIDIPIRLSCTNRVLNVYKKSKELHQASADLFVATIGVMKHILSYYKTRPTRKVLGAVFKQDDYGRQLSEQLEILRTRSEQFERFAQTCSHEGVENTRTNVRALRADVNRNNVGVHQHLSITRLESYEQFMSMERRIKEHLADILQQTFVPFLAANERLDPKTQGQRSPMLPLRKSRSAPTLRRIRDNAEKSCLARLNYKDSVIQSDIQRNLRCVHQLPKSAQDRIIAIIRHHKFKIWLVEIDSSILFLNGHYTSSAPMRQSPTSFVCAKLASSMQSYRDAIEEPSLHPPIKTIAISFFCAEHLDRNDLYQGAVGIMKSLTAQLLTSYHGFDTRVFERLQEADLDDLETLCSRFEKLVRKLPQEIILFCLVDAITIHEESEARRADVGLVLETLIDISTCDDGRSCVFKLFVTCPRVSRRYSAKVGKSDSKSVVTMPEKVPSQGAFTIAKWNDYTRAVAD